MDEMAAEIRDEMNMGSSDTALVLRESLAASAVLRDHRERCAGCGECDALDAGIAEMWDAWRAIEPWTRQGSLF